MTTTKNTQPQGSVFGLIFALILVHALASFAVGEIHRQPSETEWAVDGFLAVSVLAVGAWFYLRHRSIHILGGRSDQCLVAYTVLMIIFVGMTPLVPAGALRVIMLIITGVAVTALLVGPTAPDNPKHR